jgi:hypothetical protein
MTYKGYKIKKSGCFILVYKNSMLVEKYKLKNIKEFKPSLIKSLVDEIEKTSRGG